jgi:hypothetical protein
MTWIVKGTEGDEYLVEFRIDAYLKLQAEDWCLDQKFAHRFDQRNQAARVARQLSEHQARVVKLIPCSPRPTDMKEKRRT